MKHNIHIFLLSALLISCVPTNSGYTQTLRNKFSNLYGWSMQHKLLSLFLTLTISYLGYYGSKKAHSVIHDKALEYNTDVKKATISQKLCSYLIKPGDEKIKFNFTEKAITPITTYVSKTVEKYQFIAGFIALGGVLLYNNPPALQTLQTQFNTNPIPTLGAGALLVAVLKCIPSLGKNTDNTAFKTTLKKLTNTSILYGTEIQNNAENKEKIKKLKDQKSTLNLEKSPLLNTVNLNDPINNDPVIELEESKNSTTN